MQMKKLEYGEYLKQKTQNSHLSKNMALAFLTGGCICVIGQAFMVLYTHWGAGEQESAAFTSVTLIFLSALFTGLGLYGKLAIHAGAGTLVPITGFANAVVAPALEYQHEGYVLGTGAKLFTVAGPVLVFGISSAAIYGLLLCLFQ